MVVKNRRHEVWVVDGNAMVMPTFALTGLTAARGRRQFIPMWGKPPGTQWLSGGGRRRLSAVIDLTVTTHRTIDVDGINIDGSAGDRKAAILLWRWWRTVAHGIGTVAQVMAMTISVFDRNGDSFQITVGAAVTGGAGGSCVSQF